MKNVILIALALFALSQQYLIGQYEIINEKLQTALGQCIGLKEK